MLFFSSLISVRICVRVLVKYNLIVLCVWFVFYVHVFFFVCCCCEFYLKQNGGKSLPRSTKSFVFACFLLLRFYTDTLYLTTYSLTLCLLIRLVVFQLLFFWWIVLLSYLLSCFQLYSVFCLTAFVFTCAFFFFFWDACECLCVDNCVSLFFNVIGKWRVVLRTISRQKLRQFYWEAVLMGEQLNRCKFAIISFCFGREGEITM